MGGFFFFSQKEIEFKIGFKMSSKPLEYLIT